MSSFDSVVFAPYQDSGGYCWSEISKPSNLVEAGNSRVNSPSQILCKLSQTIFALFEISGQACTSPCSSADVCNFQAFSSISFWKRTDNLRVKEVAELSPDQKM